MKPAVAVVEDNAGVRESLVALLRGTPEFRLAGAFASGEEAVVEIPATAADVVVMDLHLPGISGIECTARLKAKLPKLHVLVLTSYEGGHPPFGSKPVFSRSR